MHNEILIFFLYILVFLFIASDIRIKIQLDVVQFIPKTRVMQNQVFYNTNYSKISYYVDTIPEREIGHALVSKGFFSLYSKIEENVVLRSIVYVITYTDAFISKTSATKRCGIHLRENVKDDDYRDHHTTVGREFYGVIYIQEFYMFGHLVHDFLTSMMYVPDYVNKSGFVVMKPITGLKIAQDWCNFLHINAKVVDLKVGSQIQVNELIAITGHENTHGVTVGGIKRLRKHIENLLGFDKIKPCKYVLANRPKEDRRSIIQIDKLFEEVKKIDERFILFNYPIKNLTENALFWSDIKIFVGPCGSQMYNSIFMRERTGFCLLFSHMDLPNVQLALASNFFLFGYVSSCEVENNFEKIDISKYIFYIKKVIYCVENNGWDNETLSTEDSPLVSRFPYKYVKSMPYVRYGSDNYRIDSQV